MRVWCQGCGFSYLWQLKANEEKSWTLGELGPSWPPKGPTEQRAEVESPGKGQGP